MAPIASTIVSCEHTAPLAARDVAAMREECWRGFERAGPEFRWDVPDLQIIVRGHIAVPWGLNRMASRQDGTVESETRSRGARLFRNVSGRWRMIHQHVSCPLDPATGQARMDLSPTA